jgi:hypothetical protein
MIHEHDQAYAINSMGLKLFIGPVPGVGEITNIRKVDAVFDGKTYGIPHCTKLDANGMPVEWRATVNGWVPA